MSSTAVDSGTAAKVAGASVALQALHAALGDTPVTDQHISATGEAVSSLSALTANIAGAVAAADPASRTAADIATVAQVTHDSLPILEQLVQDAENLWTSAKAIFAHLTAAKAAASGGSTDTPAG